MVKFAEKNQCKKILNCLAPSTLGQEEELEQLAKELDLTLSSEDSAFESDMDDLL